MRIYQNDDHCVKEDDCERFMSCVVIQVHNSYSESTPTTKIANQ